MKKLSAMKLLNRRVLYTLAHPMHTFILEHGVKLTVHDFVTLTVCTKGGKGKRKLDLNLRPSRILTDAAIHYKAYCGLE